MATATASFGASPIRALLSSRPPSRAPSPKPAQQRAQRAKDKDFGRDQSLSPKSVATSPVLRPAEAPREAPREARSEPSKTEPAAVSASDEEALDSAGRKRTKNSRACDQCRKKKIRCDATPEDEALHCSSCRRTGEKCTFSRIPMKRGPSKGQRRESVSSVAKFMRLSAQAIPPAAASPAGSEGLAGYLAGNTARGRPQLPSISSIYPTGRLSTGALASQPAAGSPPLGPEPTSPYAAPLAPHHQPRAASVSVLQQQPPSPSSVPAYSGTAKLGSSNGLSSIGPIGGSYQLYYPSPPSASSDFFKASFRGARHSSISSMDSATSASSAADSDLALAIDDKSIDSYYQTVHPTFPILPHSKVKLKARLAACNNPPLCKALLQSLKPGDNKAQVLQYIALVDQRQLDAPATVLLAMTFIFLHLANHVLEPAWLGAAFALVNTCQGPQQQRALPATAQDDCRRVWLVLVLLDRLSAAINNTPPMIPDAAVRLDAVRDTQVMGSRSALETISLGLRLGHVALSNFQTEAQVARAAIESMWDTVPSLKALYYLLIVQWARVNASQTMSESASASLIDHCAMLIQLLESPLVSVCPLVSYIIPVVARTLSEVHVADTLAHDKRVCCATLGGLIQRQFTQFSSYHHLLQSKSPLDSLAAVAENVR